MLPCGLGFGLSTLGFEFGVNGSREPKLKIQGVGSGKTSSPKIKALNPQPFIL